MKAIKVEREGVENLHILGAQSNKVSLLDTQAWVLTFHHFTLQEFGVDICAFSSNKFGRGH
jgi:hypothetical protein